ncbi:hypothetical protein BHE90_017448 [Fusarium euwallaceae]|uniref:Chromo domain-containing protein n=1 Tax=Fusarium euwallaceae TaxID=1147111 RepID=A0A430KXE8_9HYPO|nr:hypothetical protein BHE90_017448 [Fusarium euwallaceae]
MKKILYIPRPDSSLTLFNLRLRITILLARHLHHGLNHSQVVHVQLRMMIVPVHPRSLDKGVSIETPWSAHVILMEVLVTTEVDGWTFYGVRAETRDGESWDWPSTECLLWVFNDAAGFRMWQDWIQPSRFSLTEPEYKLQTIVGHCELSNGQCYLAVKWKDRVSPTWELEQDMAYFADVVTDYFTQEDFTWPESVLEQL